MGKVKPEQLSPGIECARYILCLKSSLEVSVYYDGVHTFLGFIDEQGLPESCTFRLDGNPYQLAFEETKVFPIESGGNSSSFPSAALAEMLTGFVYGVSNQAGDFSATFEAEGLTPFSADEFLDIMTTLPVSESYRRFVGLLDDDTTVDGTKFADIIETGAGADIVEGLAGNDIVNKWSTGDLRFDGGKGFDTLSFAADQGAYFPNPKTQELVLDLKSGSGQSPYGGTLDISSVEKVIGTDGADRIFGSDKADWIETQDYGADIVKARDGNDTVVLWPFAFGAILDGGAGRDRLQTSVEYLENTLDLTDPSKNTGKFENGLIKNFEVFAFSSFSFDSQTTMTFRGSNNSETVTMSGGRSIFLDLGGGNNRATGGSGADTISAGNGKDILNGGAGADQLTGGGASDHFIFTFAHGDDVITDFAATGKKHDKIDLSAFSEIKSWSDLKSNHLSTVDGSASIETSGDSSILLTGVSTSALDASDFLFG